VEDKLSDSGVARRSWLGAILLFFLVDSGSAHAQLQWSFSDHPHSAASELTKEESNALTAPFEHGARPGEDDSCRRLSEAYFRLYNDRYPRFLESGSASSRYAAWTEHIVERGAKTPATCIVGDASIALLRSMSWPNVVALVYCGKFSREPATEHEENFHGHVTQLVRYAELGSADAISHLLVAGSAGPPLELNADVEYYFRQVLRLLGTHEWNWATSHLEPLLTTDRMAVLDKLAEQRDLDTVLRTTPNCAR